VRQHQPQGPQGSVKNAAYDSHAAWPRSRRSMGLPRPPGAPSPCRRPVAGELCRGHGIASVRW